MLSDLYLNPPLVGATWGNEYAPVSRKASKRLKRFALGNICSANLVVDLNGTAQAGISIAGSSSSTAGGATVFGSGSNISVASGTTIGQSVDMLHSDTFCNLTVAGQSASGQLRIQVQTSDSDTSGNYTDPTSGLAQLPTVFQSGGILWINSGGTGQGIYGAQTSGYSIASGFLAYAGFQRVGRFARANVLTEGTVQYAGPLLVGFTSQFKTTGSGGGYSPSPTSGTVNV